MKTKFRFPGRIASVFAVILFVGGVSADSQLRPIYDRGAMGLAQMLKRLNTSASVLMIGAHPDDEDTALLTFLARGESANTAYLSLTRGDGGQNIIGPELGEALGLIRTEELLQARTLDGAKQFFTRAYDYGFSKTLAEAKEKWDEKIILCDVVSVIRAFRPLVVISQFSGTPADGHGHHQFSGYIAPLAVKAAANPSQCGGVSEAGEVWNVRKFYVRHRGQGEPTLRVNTGRFDPLLGRSYFEIAMEARSQHKSQEQGVLELRGDQYSNLNLQGSQNKEAGIFDGLDVSIQAAGTGNLAKDEALAEVQAAAQRALNEFDPRNPEKILPHLIKGYQAATAKGRFTATNPPPELFAREMRQRFADAIGAVLGLQVDALADVETIAPGESFNVSVKAYSRFRDLVQVKNISIAVPARPGLRPVSSLSEMEWWKVEKRPAPTTNSPGFIAREVGMASDHFIVTVPHDADLTVPYWLVEPRMGDMHIFSGPRDFHRLPLQRVIPRAIVTIEVGGETVFLDKPVEFRFADDIRGEIRRNINVVPKVSVETDQSLLIVPYSEKTQMRKVVVKVTSHSQRPVNGTVALNLNAPGDLKATSASPTFEIRRSGERAAIDFEVTIPPRTKAGSYPISATASVAEIRSSSTMRTIAYPHIQTHRFYLPARVDTKVIDLKTAPVKVGYLMGSGDRVPEAIRQMGFDLELISESELASGKLSRFNTIVVGIRAYQVRPDLVANNRRLLDFAANGGTLVVQYQLPGYAQQNLMPYPAQLGPRVANEEAPVNLVVPDHPILNFPNKISEGDFLNWVQERNLYNFSTMDPRYVGLLESHDPPEAENRGGLVVADVGKGKFVYCSYSMFRQLPAGVPGAYRLFANILSYQTRN